MSIGGFFSEQNKEPPTVIQLLAVLSFLTLVHFKLVKVDSTYNQQNETQNGDNLCEDGKNLLHNPPKMKTIHFFIFFN